jgi:glycosyltransferase involved in cell wall biosynthesis
MRILIITPEYPPDHGGGIITYYRELVATLVSEGCKVTILKGSAYTHGKANQTIDGVCVKYLETQRFEQWLDRLITLEMVPQLRRHLAAAFALHEQAREGQGFDVVEVVDWGMQFLPWTISSKAPFLVQLHGSNGQIAVHEPCVGHEGEDAFSLLLERAGLADAPIICGLSKLNSGWWASLLSREVHYIPPPFCVKVPDLSSHRDGWMTFGRVQGWKGPKTACDAWQLLGEKAPEVQWYGRSMVHGESGNSMADWLSEHYSGIWNRKIIHHLPVPPAEVSALMAKAKVVLVPSVWDTFNLVTAEAMAHECVAVVSDGAGSVDLVEHGVNGFVFPAGNSAALAELVQKVESLSEEKRRLIGKKAAETVSKKLNPQIVAKEKIKLYQMAKLSNAKGEWLKMALFSCAENKNKNKKQFAFLDQQPLLELVKYVTIRSINKVKKGFQCHR